MQTTMSESFGMLTQFLPSMAGGAGRSSNADMQDEPDVAACQVLIVESEVSLGRLLATGLRAEALAVEVAQDLPSALALLEKRSYSLLVVGLGFPETEGLAMLTELRERQPEARILALGGQAGTKSLVAALDHGADDYLLKPFSLIEMMARVRALRRRVPMAPASAAPKDRSLRVYRDQCRVEREGKAIDLTPREFALLEYLMQNAGKTLSRASLTQEVWNMPADANTNIVDVYIKYLRDKLDGDFDEKLIRTVRGIGYMFQAQV